MPGKQKPQLAKISPPRLYKAVRRERLFDLLDLYRERAVVWVIAPPGAGKTTLIASWLTARNYPALWYQVDPGDGDPAAFFYYLGLAEAGNSRRTRALLPLMRPEHSADVPAFARHYFRELFSRRPMRSVLVLDNFHEAADTTLSVVMRDACGEIPPGCSLIIISRGDPPPAFAEVRARDTFALVQWSDLRLTFDETHSLCVARGLSDIELARLLHTHSDGWAAGVTLMLERLRHVNANEQSLPSDMRTAVFDYFAGLLLDGTGEETGKVLVRLAYLPHFTPTMAQALTGSDEVDGLLEKLYQRHLFIDRRGGREPVYEFHALLREFLQARAEMLPVEEITRLVVHTATLVEAAGNAQSAFELYVRASDWSDAIRLVLAQAGTLLALGRWQTLKRWIASIPTHYADREPWLDYWLATAQAGTDPLGAVASFARAQQRFLEQGAQVGRVLSLSGLLRACSVDFHGYEIMQPWLDALADELESPLAFASAESELEAYAALLVAAFYLRPWHRCIEGCLQRVQALLESPVSPHQALGPASSALSVTSQIADLARADRFAFQVERFVTHPSVSQVDAVWGLFQLAFYHFVSARYEVALGCLDRALVLVEANELQHVLGTVLFHRFMVEHRVCNLAVAEATLAKMEAIPLPRHAISEALMYAYKARRALWRGEAKVAADLAVESNAAAGRSRSPFQETTFGMTNADTLLHAQEADRAKPLIARSRELMEASSPLTSHRPALFLVEAWLAWQEGRLDESLKLLKNALTGARTGTGWCRMRFVDASMRHMFAIALQYDIERDLVLDLIRRFRLKPSEGAGESWPWQVRVRTLGALEVWVDDRLLAFGRKVPKKALALIGILVALGPGKASEQQVLDALWPEEEGDAAASALGIALLRLRRLLGDNECLHRHGGKLWLDRHRVGVDAWCFEEHLATIPASARLDALEKLVAMYRGAFLPELLGDPWTIAMRERLRAKFVQLARDLALRLENAGRQDKAIDLYLKGLDVDPIVEVFYQGLMRCYEQLDRRTEAISAYRRLRQTLSITLGLKPSASTERLYRAICSE